MNTKLHNIKMILLTVIPTILGIYVLIQGQVTLPEWIATVAAALTLIEHALNGNINETQTTQTSSLESDVPVVQ